VDQLFEGIIRRFFVGSLAPIVRTSETVLNPGTSKRCLGDKPKIPEDLSGNHSNIPRLTII
jgi:hypothetical protein